MKKKITGIIIGIIIISLLWQVSEYNKLKKDAERTRKNIISLDMKGKLDLIGLLDSYGVPFSIHVQKSFLNILCQKCTEKERLSSSLDMFNLYINKTWNVEGELKNDVTIAEHVLMQNYSIDFARHKFGERNRDDLQYTYDDKTGDMTLYKYFADCKNPFILYSCAANDLFFYFDANPATITLPKLIDILLHANQGISLMKEGIAQNIDSLLDCNPSAQIYVMGLYVPTDNFFIQRAATPFVDHINHEIEDVCNQHEQVYYVDVSCLSFCVIDGDFHPNQDGQIIIAEKLTEALNKHGNENRKSNPRMEETIKTEKDRGANEKERSEEELFESVSESGLSMADYVECSVAVEKAFLDLGWDDITEKDIKRIQPGFISLWKEDPHIQSDMERAFEILYIERKILKGIDLKKHALFPEKVINDKLSLLDHY